MSIPTDWTFGAPWRLLLLLAVAALVVVHVLAQRRRSPFEARHTQVELLASVVSHRGAWRRHVPTGLVVLTLVLLTSSFAKPSAAVEVPRAEATVVLTLDSSVSMLAEDVAPTRMAAARAAATAFVEGLPDTFAVGLVSFHGQVTVVHTPTTDHHAVVASIDALEVKGGTAVGEAVAASIQAAKAIPEVQGEEPAPVSIVLLSDGISASGLPVAVAAQRAVDAGYPVTTIAYGSDSPLVKLGNTQRPLPVDAEGLAELAAATGGKAYRALDGDQLNQVLADITARTGREVERRDLSAAALGLALLSGMAAAGGSLVWFRALP
jgi:Ca-activated chloride channel family protein